jgi:4-amino-4-deoxy-L-arabinose transferase-like glycosyltransferase
MKRSVEAVPARLRRRVRTVPPPLAALAALVAIFGVTWALLVPPWQSPDEPQHFAYAESIAQRLALPGDKDRPAFSGAQRLADAAVGASRDAFYPQAAPPDWSAGDYSRYESAARGNPSSSDGGGPNSASSNPPLYYLYADLAYGVASGGNAFDRLYAMRIWGVALLVLTIVAAWLLAGEVLGRRRLAQLTCGATAGLIPAETFTSTSVNPDALMVALWTLAMWLGARVITRGAPRRDAVALCGVTAAAVLTKATSYALVPAVLLALFLGWRRRPSAERRSGWSDLGIAGLVLALPVLGWVALATALGRPAVNAIQSGAHPRPFNVRQFLSYVWQFYLPRPSFLTRFRETAGLPLYDLWIREGWGVFGWRDVAMAQWIYGMLAGLSAIVGGSILALIARFRDRLRLDLLAFFGLALLALLAGLHVTDYRAIIAGQPAVIQGRYLLPLVALFGLAVGTLLTRLPRRWRGPACGTVLAGLLILQTLALASVARGYYA